MVSESGGAPTVAVAAGEESWALSVAATAGEEPWALLAAATEKEGPGVLPSTMVGLGGWAPWLFVIPSPVIPIEDVLDEAAAKEAQESGGDKVEMETDDEGETKMKDEGGSGGPPVMEIEVESEGSRLTREEKGKEALVIEEEPAVVVPVFDRPAGDPGAEIRGRSRLDGSLF